MAKTPAVKQGRKVKNNTVIGKAGVYVYSKQNATHAKVNAFSKMNLEGRKKKPCSSVKVQKWL